MNKIVFRNCYFKNSQHKTNIWNGRGIGFYQENPADTVIIQNNTFFNNNSFAFFADISSIPPDFLLFDHNTIVNSMKFPIHSFWLPNAKVTNNLFYNAHSYGETAADKVGQDPDLLEYGIINISPIINLHLKNQTNVEINIHSINGAKVANIFNGALSQGDHSLVWNIASDIQMGTYLVRISTDNDVITKKIVVQN